ncbi:MAG: hypothetical protein R3B70_19350 [Polyangiaceae bacterium]
MADYKALLGGELYEQFRALIAWAFPGSPPPDDPTVDGAVRAFYRKHSSAATAKGLPEVPAEALAPTDEEVQEAAALRDTASYPLYIGNATHHRARSMTNSNLGSNSNVPFQSEFVGHLPLVRVPLPASFPVGQNPSVRTAIGQVYFSSDHLVGSVELVNQKFAASVGFPAARVDLITPARTGITRSRFGAIAAYLGYAGAGDFEPSFYILEAGMATGQPMVLYLGKTMDTIIVQRSGYVPTPYSSASNFYRGWLTVTDNEPVEMVVQPFPPEEQKYAQISVQYQRVNGTSNDPFELLIEAAMRVALIGQTMGVPSGVPLQEVMAGLAKTLPWVTLPEYGGSGVIDDGSTAAS